MSKINRSLGNFSEYRFKEKNNSFCFSPYSLSENIFKSLIMPNFKIALHNLEKLNQKSGATQ